MSETCYAQCGHDAIKKWREKPWCGRVECRSDINHRLWMEQCQNQGNVKGKKLNLPRKPPRKKPTE